MPDSLKTNPAAPVDLAEWAAKAERQDTVWVSPVRVPPAVLTTLVKCARALRRLEQWRDMRGDIDGIIEEALANVIDTAGPGGSG